jgi:serine/threonine protein kinase/GTPase SAR1 family protein
MRSNSRRRTRSQSRNNRASILISSAGSSAANATAGVAASASSSPMSSGIPGASSNAPAFNNLKRLLPFDLFLINLRYNRAYSTSTQTSVDDTSGSRLGLQFDQASIENQTDNGKNSLELARRDIEERELCKIERKLLNSQNIQVFIEQLCPHKRHIKLENLKSLNLCQNRLKRLSLMFDLNKPMLDIDALRAALCMSQKSEKLLNSQQFSSRSLRTSRQPLVVTAAEASGNKKGKNSNAASATASGSGGGELSLSESSDEDIDSENSGDSNELESDDGEEKQKKEAKSKNRLREKLFQSGALATLGSKKSEKADGDQSRHKQKPTYSNKNEERTRSVLISKLIYPNITHLDISWNRIRSLSGQLCYLDSLSYLNASSNMRLSRVSPKIGLLSKLWNIDLKQCPNLRYPAMLDEMVRQRTRTIDILGFLKSILEHSRPYKRIKLMFVGVQAIGKTTLLNKLREEGGSLPASSQQRQSWSERNSMNASQGSSGSSSTASFVSSALLSSSSLTGGSNISTVGIDINEWTYEKPKLKQSNVQQQLQTLLKQAQQHGEMQQFLLLLQNVLYGLNSPLPVVYFLNESLSSESSSNFAFSKAFGSITYRTWDFAGQREYYATHQYFLSRRALYLVCWKLTEEEKGINEIHHWLSNIQTRAPGSPVIIVGTHQDQLAKLRNYKEISAYLQRLIYERFVRPSNETESMCAAYPPIMASVEVSSKSGYNIKALARLIYDVSAQMRSPGMKDQLLLEQKIPVTYIALEECIYYILRRLKSQSRNPILNTVNYLKEVRDAIEALYPQANQSSSSSSSTNNYNNNNNNSNSSASNNRNIQVRFRDDAEILQATQFMHENGILIHYNDVALKDLFFLDPQWLCDLLATVVTIREINPFAAKGIMKINDLFVLFKGSRFVESDEIMSFIVDLLGKFELALTWDGMHLLIPSLLPSESMLKFSNQDIRIGIVSKQKAHSDRLNAISYTNLLSASPNSQMIASGSQINTVVKNNELTSLYSNVRLANSYSQSTLSSKLNLEFLYECKPCFSRNRLTEGQSSIRRLYCLTYLPSGFFSRLITRILSDNILKECLLELIQIDYCCLRSPDLDPDPNSDSYFSPGPDLNSGRNPNVANTDNQKQAQFQLDNLEPLIDFLCQEAEWKCWQTGIELKYLDYTLIRVKELIYDPLVELNKAANSNNAQHSTGSSHSSGHAELFLNNPVLYRDCENEFKLKSSNKQCTFVEFYASFLDYKIIKSQSKGKQGPNMTNMTNALNASNAANERKPANSRNKLSSSYSNDPDEAEMINTNADEHNDALLRVLCNRQVCIKIFALIIEIIDSLLEDWYPDLGTRFMQDSKGEYLVTRLAPCNDCVKRARLKLKNKRTIQQHISQPVTRLTESASTIAFVDPFVTSFSEHSSGSDSNSGSALNAQYLTSSASQPNLDHWNLMNVDDKYKLATVLNDNVSLLMDSSDLENRPPVSSARSSNKAKNETSSNGGFIDGAIGDYTDDNDSYSCETQQDSLKLKQFEKFDWIFCFMLDDICYSVLKNGTLLCPRHGPQSAKVIAPDLAFNDIEDRFLISTNNLKIETLLGRGSFGSVFSGSLLFRNIGYNNSTNNNSIGISHQRESKIRVAVKVLETLNKTPNNPSEARSSERKVAASSGNENRNGNELSAFIDSNKKSRESMSQYWNHRKSIRLAAKAYTIARQEISIISCLKHENIVTMIGLSVQPLAIILELAPMGNLKDILNEYKSNMCKLSAPVIQRVCMQVSGALSYLHANRIIYRDLKAENVLVWKFPRWNSQTSMNSSNNNLSMQATFFSSISSIDTINNSSNEVLLKLADYSISRSTLPTGTKGFAGTEGFMAPEIVRYNGEETYSEKVDCFSFGMLLYELITLRHPFQNQEQIKDIILSGGRPLVKAQDVLYPTLMLDIMCLCWLDNPNERPSALKINEYAGSYEFSHLLDVTVLEDYEQPPLVVTCLNQEIDIEIDESIESDEENYSAAAKVAPHEKSNSYGNYGNYGNYGELDEEEIEEDLLDVWIVRNCLDEATTQLEVLTYENRLNCTARKLINVSCEKIEALCVYNGTQVWCVDSSKCIYIYW